MSDLHDDDIVFQEPMTSVGEQLKSVREEKKLTVGEIAAQLRLTQETIINLETEQWDKLPGRAYARGYFLSYVRFLGLPEQDMLTAFNLDYKASDTGSTSPRMFEPQKASFPWLQIALVVVVISITWFAYQQWQQSQVSSTISEKVSQLSQLLDKKNNDRFSSSVVEPLPILEQETSLPAETAGQIDEEQPTLELQ
jgi:cytoskeleton protein RodZ